MSGKWRMRSCECLYIRGKIKLQWWWMHSFFIILRFLHSSWKMKCKKMLGSFKSCRLLLMFCEPFWNFQIKNLYLEWKFHRMTSFFLKLFLWLKWNFCILIYRIFFIATTFIQLTFIHINFFNEFTSYFFFIYFFIKSSWSNN